MAKDELDELLNEPPDPRGAGESEPEKSEEQAINQIERDDKADAIDDMYSKDSDPEEPMLVVGDEKRGVWAKINRPKVWLSLVAIVVLALLFVWLITPSRVWLLNTLGLRTHLTITTNVSSATTPQPLLKNVTITINGTNYHTDDNGTLRLTMPYGFVHIVVSKTGYEGATKDETLDYDPFFYAVGGKQSDDNMRNLTFALKSVGIPVSFTATDYFTGQPITQGTFSVGDVIGMPDPNGSISLIVPATDSKTVSLKATFSNTYAAKTIDLPLQNTPSTFSFVQAGRDYFISKRSGELGVYSANLDGSDVQTVVTPSAHETGDIAFSVSPDGKYGVLATTRDLTHDNVGALQQKLYIVDMATNKMTAVDTALQFAFVDWSGDTVVYQATSHDSSAPLRLASLDATKAKQTNLATPSPIKIARVSLGSVVYLTNAGELHVVKIGGSDKILGTDANNLTQIDTTTFLFRTSDKAWHKYDVNADVLTSIPAPTSTQRAFLASQSADGQTNLVVDIVDSTLTLFAKNVADGKETKLYAGNDLTGPVRWVGNIAVYRVLGADYAVSPSGGSPKKITDVTPNIELQNNGYFSFN